MFFVNRGSFDFLLMNGFSEFVYIIYTKQQKGMLMLKDELKVF